MWFATKNKFIFFIPIMNGLYVIKMMGDWKKEGLSFWVRSKRFLLAVAAILIPFIVLAEISYRCPVTETVIDWLFPYVIPMIMGLVMEKSNRT